MKSVYPNYYKKFKCIADKCQHSCCIGWEIDIDETSLKYYNTVGGQFGERLRGAISYDGEPHFILCEGERCPFLNKNGLCDMFTILGEDSLCEICTLHPRFKNYFDRVLEIGLGLCCEAAAELIINCSEPFELIRDTVSSSDFSYDELKLLKARDELIGIMKDRTLSISKRHQMLLDRHSVKFPDLSVSDWCDLFLSLERLDENWSLILNELKKKNVTDWYDKVNKENSVQFEQLTIYFLYRYIASGTYDNIRDYLAFSVLSSRMIATLLNVEKCSLIEYSRMYSSEIEYSDQNVSLLCYEFTSI